MMIQGRLAGGAIASSSVDPSDELKGLAILAGTVLGGVVGMVGGAIVGSRHTERWDSLRLPVNIGLLPSNHGIRLSAALTNR